MSNSPRSLLIGDAVRLYTDDINIRQSQNARQAIGFVRFIGFIPSFKSDSLHSFVQYVGVELLQKIERGHDGLINKTQYFNVEHGYGLHVPIVNIIEVLSIPTLMSELKNVLSLLKAKNDYIKGLETEKLYGSPKPLPIDVNVPRLNLYQKTNTSFRFDTPITPMSKTGTRTRYSISSTTSSPPDIVSPYDMDLFSTHLKQTMDENQDGGLRLQLAASSSNQYSPTPVSRSGVTPTNTPVRPSLSLTGTWSNGAPARPNKRRAHRRKNIKTENQGKRLAMLYRAPVPEFRKNASNMYGPMVEKNTMRQSFIYTSQALQPLFDK
eukprot:274364_1